MPFHVRKLDLIWSAGKTGFGSSEQDCVAEIAHFQAFILSAKSIESKYQVPFFVHYLSSAGALFEGQLRVDDFTVPRPMRPYGFAKLFQESLLTSTFPKGYVVYRPSSIYGPSKNGTRVGLISRLLTCIYSFTEISIFGGMNTLRDFVWVYDVAEFISAQVSTKAAIGGRLYHLVSGKPSSIFEVSQVVAKVSGKRMLFRVEKYDDDLSMSFSSCISCCRTTNLEYGIRSTFLRQF
ncbi:MAG: NAD-dependent epimerase/dehydratase family protein [Cyclobacteriaceae bacterium]|nr:NAD-dependent epimerase/dehydratase family protein [Cyclobacteriaceae bacterium]